MWKASAWDIFKSPSLAFEGIRTILQTDPIRSWFFSTLVVQYSLSLEGWRAPFGTYYEFGVSSGGTLTKFAAALKSFCKYTKYDQSKYEIFAFDSFQGLPKSTEQRDSHPSWKEGTFAATEEIALMEARKLCPKTKIRAIKGFFEKSLTDSLRKELARSPPSIINLDVDYYSSTKIALDWLEPIMPSGCLIYFDDIWSFFGNPNMGQLYAIQEFNNRGEGILTPYSSIRQSILIGKTFIYSRKNFEYKSNDF